ncbi:uncharacterized protein C1orf87 homolog isoform X1 [Panthera tigris]|uniref:uncharacterized protein C1orf87 homolog isoform X1 n=1 Tax=Panthera tigris TaxID=9694 RepID=UPI001C6F7B20|nr:uncharacterized protein C1orf87 homolog isoform X1 [Panthera tigris]
MSSVWKTTCGSDAVPEMVVKIIGSKHFRYLMEKPEIKENENLKAETQTVLQKSMIGSARQMSRDSPAPTNPTDHQINHDPEDEEENKHQENNQSPENNQKFLTGALTSRFLDGKIPIQANAHCSSVPTGDQSLSYIHGLPGRNLRDWSLEQMARDSSDQPKVSYGKLLWFLKAAASGDPQQSQRVVGSNWNKSQSYHDHGQGTARQDASPQSEVSKSLSEILMALRTPNGKLNIENLSRNFQKEDRSFSGSLPLPKVRAICGKHGLYLTLSFLETLRSHQNLGYHGEIKWQNFVELLSKASSDLPHDLPTGKKAKETSATTMQAEVAKISQGRTEHMKIPEEELQPENPPAEISSPKDPLKALKVRPISQPLVTPMMKNEPEEYETWTDKFRKLENALYLCDLTNTGVLEKERARRLIHNYNLIYNLSLSPRKIDQALRRFRAGENMLLEPALQYLKEL